MRRVENGRDLRRVVGVVVDDAHAARLAALLEPAANPAETREYGQRVDAVDTGELERCERRGRVSPVVLAGNRELDVERLELPAANRLRHVSDPVVEQPLQLGSGRELGVMIKLDVEHDGDLRPQRGDRAVRLVALDDEPSLARTGV